MKLENQVTNLELSRKLKSLGVKQESLFYWGDRVKGLTLFHRSGYTDIESGVTFYTAVDGQDDVVESQLIASAFTVAELGAMLPKNCASMLNLYEGEEDFVCFFTADKEQRKDQHADTEANSRAKMLIYLIENGLIKS